MQHDNKKPSSALFLWLHNPKGWMVGKTASGVGTGQSQVRQCADGLVLHHAGVVENLLKLGCGSAAFVRRQISLATQINGVEIELDRPEFIGRSRDERFEWTLLALPLWRAATAWIMGRKSNCTIVSSGNGYSLRLFSTPHRPLSGGPRSSDCSESCQHVTLRVFADTVR